MVQNMDYHTDPSIDDLNTINMAGKKNIVERNYKASTYSRIIAHNILSQSKK